jgi:hypothetical protein
MLPGNEANFIVGLFVHAICFLSLKAKVPNDKEA